MYPLALIHKYDYGLMSYSFILALVIEIVRLPPEKMLAEPMTLKHTKLCSKSFPFFQTFLFELNLQAIVTVSNNVLFTDVKLYILPLCQI